MTDRCCICAEVGETVCTCSSSPLLYCDRCAEVHQSTPAPHSFSVVSDLKCRECGEKTADFVCLCEAPGREVCEMCGETHRKRHSEKKHVFESKLVNFIVRSEEERRRFLTRLTHFDRMETILKSNLTSIETCKQTVEKVTASLIEEISTWMSHKMQELDAIEHDMKLRIDSILTTIKDNKYTRLDRDNVLDGLMQIPGEMNGKLTVFTYNTTNLPNVNNLKNAVNFVYESHKFDVFMEPEIPPITSLPLIFYRNLRVFSLIDFRENTLKLRTKAHINDGSSLCHVSNNMVFVCGGEYPVHALVYVINLGDGSVGKHRDMMVARRFPGLMAGENGVWIFGGSDGKRSLAAAEFYHLRESHSLRLPDMLSPREKFTPCSYKHFILLTGGVGTTTIESYDLNRRVYEGFSLRLPASDCTTSVVHGDNLVILQANQMLICNLQTPKMEVHTHIPTGNWWSSIQPVKFRGYYYFFRVDFNLLFDRGLVDVLVSSFKKVVNIHHASLYSLELESLRLTELRDIQY